MEGQLGDLVTAKDVILRILKEIRTDGARYRAVEFAGPSIQEMDLAGRITLTSMVTEMSGMIGFVEPDESILDFLNQRTQSEVEPISADVDAEYEKTVRFDVTDLEPQIACPHSPDNVKNVTDVAGTRIDQVFIGSCTNGRAEDLKQAAALLNGKKVKTRLIVVPATAEVAKEILRNGVHKAFLDAGGVVSNPSCALCTHGHPGILAPGETMVSTSNRNFVGKLGTGAEVYLGSPATAAASAITGVITDPREL